MNKIQPTIPFTQTKFDELKQKRDNLNKEQKEVMHRLQVAREMGDLSENGAYKYAKFELGNIRRQLRDLNYQINNGYVPAKSNNDDQINFGDVVEIKVNDKLTQYQIVSKFESDPIHGKLSQESPLGKSLIGKKVGDDGSFDSPKGKQKFIIVAKRTS